MKIAALLVVPCLVVGAPVHALEFFPAEPGLGEKVYLIYSDSCGDNPPEGRPVMTALDGGHGYWEFRLELVFDTICFATPPEGSARVYAFEIPERIGGIPVHEIRTVTRTSYMGDADEVVALLQRPLPAPVPPSVTGAWHAESGREQGLLVTMDDTGGLVVNLATYDAQGAKAWYSGRAQGNFETVTIPLSDTGDGVFLGTSSSDVPARAWGEIDLTWLACGRMTMAWRPAAYTGLAAGETELMQLTSSYSAPCNLARYAGLRNGMPQYVDYDVVVQ